MVLMQEDGRTADDIAREVAQNGLKFASDDLVYGPSAGKNLRNLQEAAGGKTLTDIGSPFDFGLGQDWPEFSKQQMDAAVASGNKIHFDLTEVKNLDGVLQNSGQYADSVTAVELRYIRDNWPRFKDSVKFYIHGQEVKAPWLP